MGRGYQRGRHKAGMIGLVLGRIGTAAAKPALVVRCIRRQDEALLIPAWPRRHGFCCVCGDDCGRRTMSASRFHCALAAATAAISTAQAQYTTGPSRWGANDEI